jgi:hypothetical protein
MLSALLLCAAVLTPFFQALATEPTKAGEKTSPTSSVSGRVVTAADASPLKAARIVLIPERRQSTSGPQAYSAMSDADGRFNIKGVPAGRYQFLASHTGYVDQQYQSSGGEKGVVLALTPGQEVKDVLFRMSRAAVITGVVTDDDGEPMENIQVVALHQPSEDEIDENPWLQHRELTSAAAAQTDDRGHYRLFGLKAGEYFIRAVDQFAPPRMVIMPSYEWEVRSSIGTQYAPVYYPGVTQRSQAQAVAVEPGDEVQADFILLRTKTVEISGKVIGIDGKPATNLSVFLIETPPSEFSSNQDASSDAKGEFKLRGVPPGNYMLMANESSTGDGIDYHAQEKIEVGEDNVDSIMLALGRGTKISGRVAVANGNLRLERLSITLTSPELEIYGGSSKLKEDGSFEIVDVPDGSFTFEVNGLEEGYYIRSARLGRDDILANGLQIAKGQTTGAIQVVLSHSTAQLEGSVTQDGTPLTGARVRLTPTPETAYNRTRAQTTRTDQSGHFMFAAIAPGQYKVLAKVSPQEATKPAASDPQFVNISEDEHRQIQLTVISTTE